MPISVAKRRQLEERLAELGVREEELEEQFVRSRGPGGQHVNKSSTGVVLIHRPSGIEIKCDSERSQAMNRFMARRRLAERLEERLHKRRSVAAKRRWKIRKQKKRRSKRAKEKVLEEKRKQSEKKSRRRPVRSNHHE